MTGHLSIKLDTYADFTNLAQQTAQRNSMVVLQPWHTAQLATIKAANPKCKVICHKNLGGALQVAPTDGVYSSGLPYRDAGQWALGPTMYGYANLYAMDVGDHAYQMAWADAVCEELKEAGWDGALLDNSDLKPAFNASGTKYPDDLAWQGAMDGCLAYVGARFKAEGLLAIPNIGAWGGYPNLGREWLTYVDGAMHEQFVKWGNVAGTGYADPARWRSDVDSLRYATSRGKWLLAVTHSAPNDHQAALYGWASALLGQAISILGKAVYCFAADYAHELWIPEFDAKLGRPIGASGSNQRGFKWGTVSVDPVAHKGTILTN